MRHVLSVVILAMVPAAASAQDIYKCTAGGSVAYQSTPCASGQVEKRLAVGPSMPRGEIVAAADARPAVTVPGAAALRRTGPWRNQTLVLGMSDDEVLNMPAWGRPAHIARSRVSRAWHEVWTYATPSPGERQLHFVNARLAGIGDAPPAKLAQLTSQ
jgi:hypothetical protein